MKNEIKCPKCGTVFQINENDYESILAQIKNHEFNDALNKKEKEILDNQAKQLELVKAQTESSFKDELSKKDEEYKKLQAEYNKLQLEASKKEQDSQKELNEQVNAKNEKIASLEKQIELAEETKKSAIQEAIAKEKEINQENLIKITNLENEIKNKEAEGKLKLSEALNEKEKEITKLSNDLANNDKNHLEKETALKERYESELKMKEEEIERYRDFKAKQVIKLVGESLEQHCEIEYNKTLRPILPTAYFEKDNKVSDSGSKGDFIFKDYDDEGNEYISIMFEMKNEAEDASNKQKNEKFLKELDKDRNEKNCEYAVLVSLLEADNELYNTGIVDMSHKYPKMYVVRPQFFIPIITMLRNAAMKTIDYKKQLIVAQSQNIDLTNFEDNLSKFKDAFGKNYETASKKFQTAIDEIDKTIDHLRKTKEALLSSDRNLRLANDKAQDITVKKLTKNAQSIKEKIEEISKNKKNKD